MILILSPAKKLDFIPNSLQGDLPKFHQDAIPLIKKLRTYSKPKLMGLMNISQALAELNQKRYDDFQELPEAAVQKTAMHAFNGDVYQGLRAEDFDKKSLDFAQKHVRILSGLYGCLKPLDLIQAYRLEMGSKLPIRRKKNLYEYWSEKVTAEFNEILSTQDDPTLVNLASNEYAKVINFKALKHPVVVINFREWRDGKLKAIQFNLKKARGTMTRYAIDKKIKQATDLKQFDYDDYHFDPALSDDNNWFFVK